MLSTPKRSKAWFDSVILNGLLREVVNAHPHLLYLLKIMKFHFWLMHFHLYVRVVLYFNIILITFWLYLCRRAPSLMSSRQFPVDYSSLNVSRSLIVKPYQRQKKRENIVQETLELRKAIYYGNNIIKHSTSEDNRFK